MSEITFTESRPHKSVAGIGAFALPSPAVLAGVNGAGKSHLLQAINEGAIRAYIEGDLIDIEDVVLYDWTDFSVKGPGSAAGWKIAQRREQLWEALNSQLTNGRAAQRIKTHNERVGTQLTREQLLRTSLANLALDSGTLNKLDNERRRIQKELLQALNENQKELVKAIERATGKLIVELTRNEFTLIADMVASPVDPLQLRTSELFLAYRSAFDRNKLLRLSAQHEGSGVGYLSEDDFQKAYGPPPWDVLNDLLADLGLDFEVDSPSMVADSYDVRLTQRTSGAEVPFQDLSSGEKVLMALAISLYGSNQRHHRIKLPKLMLLDEVDAPLHPEMTRMYFRVIDELLVANGVAVVLATHNPSTVALAPEGAVYRMSKTAPRIVEVTNQQALAHLTTGVTALTVRFNERRVVLVEGDSDADAYTAVLDALRIHMDAEYGIAFVSGGMRAGEGGSSVVRRNVRLLRDAGAEVIYGLIDRDASNEPSPDGTVLVLGAEGRYTLENYLFDPLLLAALAVRQKFSQRIDGLEELLDSSVGTWRGLDRSDSTSLQRISDHMLTKIVAKDVPNQQSTVTAHLVGGQSIELPRWFVDMPGHTLAERWMQGIPRLKHYRNEEELRQAIITYVVADIPQLLSRDFLDVMNALAGHNSSPD